MAKYTVTLKDHSDESTLSEMNVDPAIDALSKSALVNAIVGVTLGQVQRAKFTEIEFLGSGVATDPLAQREIKLLVGIQDDVTGKPYTFTIGTFDLQANPPAQGTEFVALDATPAIIALVSAVDAHVKSPVGNAVTTTYLKFVGRST